MQQGQIEAGQWLAVFGCGGVGLSAVMIGAAHGAQVIAIDTQPAALQYAERFGARHLVRWESARQVGEAIRTITPGGVQVSLDALGDADVIAASIRCLRKQGLHMQVGLLGGSLKEKTVPVDRIVALELRLAGSHGMAVDGYHQILADMAAGAYRPADLVARRVGLSEAARLLPKIPASDLAGVTIIEPDRP